MRRRKSTCRPISSAHDLANISTRGQVQTGDNVLIGAIIIRGGDPADVVVRAIGPSLTARGVANALQDPTLSLVDQNGDVIGFNDNWQDSQQSRIADSGLAPSDSRESAIRRSLSSGNYTAIVRGQLGSDGSPTTGVALVEPYNLPVAPSSHSR
jgi:hypothetical protein